MSATGSIAPNLHEGSRSEYLALYVFSMFGTAVQVPRQEDFGVDLYCTLFSERDGQRVWPEAYYAVQVKSDETVLTFPHPKSVEWVVRYPAPLFLCIVEKKAGLIRVYQTFARFGAAVSNALPSSFVMVPEGREDPAAGAYGQDGDGRYLLGAPILRFRIKDLLDDAKFQSIREVLRFWVIRDFENVRRYQMGMRSLWMPWEVRTNEIPPGPASVVSLAVADPETRVESENTLSMVLDFLIQPWVRDGKKLQALLAAMLLRSQGASSVNAFMAMWLLHEGQDFNSDECNAKLDELLRELAEHYP